jgi:hypothetical protein
MKAFLARCQSAHSSWIYMKMKIKKLKKRNKNTQTNLKVEKGKKKVKKCTFLPLHWFFTNDSISDGNNKQSKMMAK